MTAHLIRTLARSTRLCVTHGDIVEVNVDHDGRVVDSGSYMAVTHYTVTFADGAVKRYWLRGYVPVEIR